MSEFACEPGPNVQSIPGRSCEPRCPSAGGSPDSSSTSRSPNSSKQQHHHHQCLPIECAPSFSGWSGGAAAAAAEREQSEQLRMALQQQQQQQQQQRQQQRQQHGLCKPHDSSCRRQPGQQVPPPLVACAGMQQWQCSLEAPGSHLWAQHPVGLKPLRIRRNSAPDSSPPKQPSLALRRRKSTGTIAGLTISPCSWAGLHPTESSLLPSGCSSNDAVLGSMWQMVLDCSLSNAGAHQPSLAPAHVHTAAGHDSQSLPSSPCSQVNLEQYKQVAGAQAPAGHISRLAAAAAEPARRSPTPPGSLPGFCASPRASLLLKQISLSGSSAGSSSGGQGPSTAGHSSSGAGSSSSHMPMLRGTRSPGAAAMVMPGQGVTSYLCQQQAPDAGCGQVPRVKPVARDITHSLQLCGPGPKASSKHGSAAMDAGQHLADALHQLQHSHVSTMGVDCDWGQQQYPELDPDQHRGLHEPAGSSSSSRGLDAASTSDQLLDKPVAPTRGGGKQGGTSSNSAGGSRLPAPRASSTSSITMSPAPPPVPPSPQQQHAAELRIRRGSSNSSIPHPCSMSPTPAALQTIWPAISSAQERGSVQQQQQQQQQAGLLWGEHRRGTIAPLERLRGASALSISVPASAPMPDSWPQILAAVDSPLGQVQLPTMSGQQEQQQQQQQQQQSLLAAQCLPHSELSPCIFTRDWADAGNSRERLSEPIGCTGSLLGASGSSSKVEELGDNNSCSALGVGISAAQQQQQDQHQHQQQPNLKALALSVMGKGRLSMGAALPPIHPTSYSQHDLPSTPRDQGMFTPKGGRGTGLPALSQSHQPELQQHQQPVPPRQHAPACRSPCVNTRLHTAVSPRPASMWTGSAAFPAHPTPCSPIYEVDGSGGSSSQQGGSAVSSSTPDGGNGTGSSRGSKRASGLLPLPAFDQLALSGSLELPPHLQQDQQDHLAQQQRQQQQQHGLAHRMPQQHIPLGLRSPSPPSAPDAGHHPHSAARHLVHAGSPIYTHSTPAAAAAASTSAVHTAYHSSAGPMGSAASPARQHQRLIVPMSPSPPPCGPVGASGLLLVSPKVGSGLVHAGAAHPCPPVNSLPPAAPSPSVKSRLLHAHSLPAGAVQTGQLGLTHGALAAHYTGGTAVPVPASAAAAAGGLGVSAVPMAAADADSSHSPVVVKAPMHCPGLSASITGSTAADAPAAAGAAPSDREDKQKQQLSGLLASVLPPWTLADAANKPPGASSLQQSPVQPAEEAAPAGNHSNSSAFLHEQRLRDSRPTAGDGAPSCTAAAVAAAAVEGLSATSSSTQTAASAGSVSTAWQWPAVVAFGHYKGRLGYLMTSGVSGVLFADGSNMMMRSGDCGAYYHAPLRTSASAAAATECCGAAAAWGLDPTTADTAKTGSPATSAVEVQLQGSAGRAQVVAAKDQGATSSGSSCSAGITRTISTDISHSDQGTDQATQPDKAAPAAASSRVARTDDNRYSAGQFFLLPGASQSSSSSIMSDCMPEALASKARCLQRFARCLVHRQPYSSKCQPDITRLVLPEVVQQQQLLTQGPEQPVVSYVQSFIYQEGCLVLQLTDGSQQLVFTSDNSVLLISPGCKQLAYITPPLRKRKPRIRRNRQPVGTTGRGGQPALNSTSALLLGTSDSCSDSSNEAEEDTSSAGKPGADIMLLGAGDSAVVPANPRLLEQLRAACKVCNLPSWLAAGTVMMS